MAAAQAIEYDAQGKPLPPTPTGVEYDAQGRPLSSSAEPPSFFESLGHTFGIGKEEEAERQEHPIRSAIESYPPVALAEGLGRGFMRSTDELGKGVDALRAGNPAEAGVHAISAIPFAGPGMMRASEQAPASTPDESYLSRIGDVATNPGAMGTLAGTALQVAPMVMGDTAGRITRPISDAVTGGLKRSGEGILNRTVGATKPDFSHGANPAGGYLAGGGKPAWTMGGLARNAEGVNARAGAKLGNLYDTATAKGVGFPETSVRSQLEQPLSVYEAEQEGPGATGASPLIGEYRYRMMSRPPSGRLPSPIRGFLAPPVQEVPLADSPYIEGRPSEPIRLTQANRPGQLQLQAPTLSTPMAPGMQGEFPGRLASADTGIRQTEFGDHPGMGQAQYMGEIPGERGGPGQFNGVWRKQPPPMSNSTVPGKPYYTPNDVFSLKRSIAKQARWNSQEPIGLNDVRQEQVGRLGGMLTDVIPEAKPQNQIFQGSLRLANRAAQRADTGSAPLTQIGRRAFESGIGGLGYMTGHPYAGMIPLLADTVPVKSTAGWGLYNAGRGLGTELPPLFRPTAAVSGIYNKEPKKESDDEK